MNEQYYLLMKVKLANGIWLGCSCDSYYIMEKAKRVFYLMDNGRLSKIDHRDSIKRIINSILAYRFRHGTDIKHYIITTYPKVYIREISDDIASDCNKVMFNKDNLDAITNIPWTEIYSKMADITGSDKNNIMIGVNDNIGSVPYVLNYVKSVKCNAQMCPGIVTVSTKCDPSEEIINDVLCTSCIHAFLSHGVDYVGGLKSVKRIFKAIKDHLKVDNTTNKNTVTRLLSEVNIMRKMVRMKEVTEKTEENKTMYDKLASKLMLRSIDKRLTKMFITDKSSVKRFEMMVDQAHNKILPKLNIMLSDMDIEDKINGSGEMFKSFITMMSWVEELETQGCVGIALSINVKKMGNQTTIKFNEIPLTCLATLDFIDMVISDTVAMHDTRRINSLVIASEPYKKSSINVVLPLYINDMHWKIASKYLQITANMINYYYPFTKDRRFWKIYFNVLHGYVGKLYGDISENEVKMFMAYWKTASEIRRLFKIKCDTVIKSDKVKDYRYFDYSSLMGQILSDPVNDPDRLRITLKYYMTSICSKDNGILLTQDYGNYCTLRYYFSQLIRDIASVIHFYTTVHREYVQTLDNMNSSYSVCSDNDANSIKGKIVNFNTTVMEKHVADENSFNVYCFQLDGDDVLVEYINDFMHVKYPQYQLVTEMKNSIKKMNGNAPDTGEECIYHTLNAYNGAAPEGEQLNAPSMWNEWDTSGNDNNTGWDASAWEDPGTGWAGEPAEPSLEGW